MMRKLLMGLMLSGYMLGVCGNTGGQGGSPVQEAQVPIGMNKPGKGLNFEAWLRLLNTITDGWKRPKADIAKAAGLKEIYYCEADEGEFISYSFYYGKDALMVHNEEGWLQPQSDHPNAIVFGVEASTSSGGEIYFKNAADLDDFMQKAKKHGLVVDENGQLYIVDEKVPSGITKTTSAELYNEKHQKYHPRYTITPADELSKGWSVCHIGIDF